MDRTKIRVNAFNRKRRRFGEDLCSIVSFVSSPDGFGGSTDTPTTLASGVRCFYEPLTTGDRVVAGAQSASSTHKITMEATAITKAIKSDQQIVLLGRNGKPSITFERPALMDGSFTPLVEVVAAAVR